MTHQFISSLWTILMIILALSIITFVIGVYFITKVLTAFHDGGGEMNFRSISAEATKAIASANKKLADYGFTFVFQLGDYIGIRSTVFLAYLNFHSIFELSVKKRYLHVHLGLGLFQFGLFIPVKGYVPETDSSKEKEEQI